jgi:hypothetical protein
MSDRGYRATADYAGQRDRTEVFTPNRTATVQPVVYQP